MNNTFRHLWPLFLIFVLNILLIFFLKNVLDKYNIDSNVILAANVLFLLLSCVAYAMQRKALNNKNPNVFIRSVMGAMLVKMFICVIVVFIYISIIGNQYNKKGVFISLFLYLFYLAAEVISLMKLNKKPHG